MSYPLQFNSDMSKRTPWIILEPGHIFIMGRSIPENPGEFYRPVHEWISRYVKEYSGESRIDLGFEYINTTSTKWVYTLLKELSEMEELSRKATVTWYFEQGDDDMSELGFILRSLVDCPFFVVEVDLMNRKKYENILTGSV